MTSEINDNKNVAYIKFNEFKDLVIGMDKLKTRLHQLFHNVAGNYDPTLTDDRITFQNPMDLKLVTTILKDAFEREYILPREQASIMLGVQEVSVHTSEQFFLPVKGIAL